MNIKLLLVSIGILSLLIVSVGVFIILNKNTPVTPNTKLWKVESIDTMKYSRDTAREYATDHTFDVEIDQTMADIHATGATHVGIGTPYDPEFIPYLTRWVDAARRQNLNVWFRGNFSGWEGWFEYKKISREDHKLLLSEFLRANPGLFKDGDIISPCPECENGGAGDPRSTGDVIGFRQFLIDETAIADASFKKIGVSVAANYHSMNGDVARLVMDKATTKKLGGIIVVDHYVSTPAQLASSIDDFARSSGGKVILGEFGAPIPDLNGDLNEEQQAAWIEQALLLLAQKKNLVGLNYWVNRGGSTALWNDDGTPRKAVQSLSNYYKPTYITIRVVDQSGSFVSAKATVAGREYKTDSQSLLHIPLVSGSKVLVSSKNNQASEITLSKDSNNTTIVFNIKKENFLDYLIKLLQLT